MRSRGTAGALGTLVVLCGIGAVVATAVRGWTLEEALDAFVVSNLLIGLGFGLCGALIAWHRPELSLGWLFAVGGLLQILSALSAPLAAALDEAGAPEGGVRLLLTVFAWAWPVNIAVVLPLSLLLLPDGRLPSPGWRPVAIAIAATAPLSSSRSGWHRWSWPGSPSPTGRCPGTPTSPGSGR